MIKSMIIAISMYSKIPVPHFGWKEKDLKYVLCFFPFIGVIIGLLEYAWYVVCDKAEIGMMAYTAIGTAIPILVTGGFHIDGYMDTMDAIHSYQSEDRKLEILKDSHIGAFAAIMLALYVLLFVAGYSELTDEKCFSVFCFAFVISRILSGLSLVTFPKAKKDGMLATFSDAASKKTVRIILIIELILTVSAMIYMDIIAGLVAVFAAVVVFLYYRVFAVKNFGGITGDIAGYFLTVCELVIMLCVTFAQIVLGR